jgi:RNA polymerase sigma factor (TIGR02999 family)
MAENSPDDVTPLLRNWCRGDKAALDKIIPLVYDELHRLAHRYIKREWKADSPQTTALVNETYLRLIDAKHVEWRNRAHFFAVSARLMRRILVEFAAAHLVPDKIAGSVSSRSLPGNHKELPLRPSWQ